MWTFFLCLSERSLRPNFGKPWNDCFISRLFILTNAKADKLPMKIQTTAHIESFSVDGQFWELNHSKTIDLEFSAIDTGGGYKDPILDFSCSVQKTDTANFDEEEYPITITLSDPDKEDNEVTFSYQGLLRAKDDNLLEVNGRLKDDQLSRQLIGFVLQLLR